MQNDNLKNEKPTDANNVLADVYCPRCGLDTPQLFEGYCEPCFVEKQYQLDTYNNQYDRWGKLSYEQRNAEISGVINYR